MLDDYFGDNWKHYDEVGAFIEYREFEPQPHIRHQKYQN
jgi:hypothetical protein